MELDMSSLGGITLAGLAVIGAVNAATMWKPDLDSRAKFVLSVVVALLIGLVPQDLNVEILNRLVSALTVAFAASGGYKVVQKVGTLR